MTKRYAVIGDPVSHSLSPLMHSGWIEAYGLDATYEALHLRSDDPIAAIRGLKFLAGVNVTVPHKDAAASAAERASATVRQLNAANTLTWRDGILFGDNTDASGFTLALEEAAPDWREAKTALVIGAGGAGRAVAYGLAGQNGPVITIVNRTFERADAAARMIGPHCGQTVISRPWSALAECIAEADIIVNATILGLNGAPFDWPTKHARAGAIVADIVYRPLETPLLRQARASGLKTVDGLGMLIHQGALSFEIWHGVKPDVARARSLLEAALR
jgi:shikimate dehydrogenase